MAEHNLNDYENMLSGINAELTRLTDKDDQLFQVKSKANEIYQTLGEAKTYLSGQPLLKYAYKTGGKLVKQALNKGVKKPDGYDEAAEGDNTEAADIVADQNTIVDTTREVSSEAADSALSGSSALGESAESVAVSSRVVGASGLENSLMGSSSSAVAESSGLRAAGDVVGGDEFGIGARIGQTGGEAVPIQGNNVLSGESEAISKVEAVNKADAEVDKAAAGEEAGEGAGEAAGAAGEEAGEEAALGAADSIPFVDILGLIGGAVLTIESLKHKPKLQQPVDRINASYQIGI